MNYRATRLSNGYSPAELLFGRKIKTLLPQIPEKLKPITVNQKSLRQKESMSRDYSKRNYDLRRRAQTLKPIQEGDNVFVKNFNVDGKIIKEADRPRSYVVDTPRGVISRNRRHLVKLHTDVKLYEPTDFQLGEERECRNLSNNTSNVINQESDTPSSHTTVQSSEAQQISDKHYVTRSGRISKPPERLEL